MTAASPFERHQTRVRLLRELWRCRWFQWTAVLTGCGAGAAFWGAVIWMWMTR